MFSFNTSPNACKNNSCILSGLTIIGLIFFYGYLVYKNDGDGPRHWTFGGWPGVFLEEWERKVKERAQEEYNKQYNYLPEEHEKKD